MTVLALAVAASLVFGHGGKTDERGCHTEAATGEYHCHKQQPGKASTAKPKGKCVPERDASGRIRRDWRQRRAFIEKNPCPVTGSRNHRESCPDYHVDHVVPLACCGGDDPSNMKWTKAEENLAKGSRCPWDPPREKTSR